MTHKIRQQRQKFECTHVGFGKFCHRCKDEAAGRIKIPVVSAGFIEINQAFPEERVVF